MFDLLTQVSKEADDWHKLYMAERTLSEAISRDCNATALERNALRSELASAVEALRDIAAIKGMSKRQRANSERAITWLYAHGYPLEPGGYVPGVGFTEET
jgi:hypothetical protein